MKNQTMDQLIHPTMDPDNTEYSSEESIELSLGDDPRTQANNAVRNAQTFIIATAVLSTVAVCALTFLAHTLAGKSWALFACAAGAALVLLAGLAEIKKSFQRCRVHIAAAFDDESLKPVVTSWLSPGAELHRAIKQQDFEAVRRVLAAPAFDVNKSHLPGVPVPLVDAVQYYRSRSGCAIIGALLENGATRCLDGFRSEGDFLSCYTLRDLVIPAALSECLREGIESQKSKRETQESKKAQEDLHDVFMQITETHETQVLVDYIETSDDHIDRQDSTGRSLLHWSVRAGNAEFVRALAYAGASFDTIPDAFTNIFPELETGGPFDKVSDPATLERLKNAFEQGAREREADALRRTLEQLEAIQPVATPKPRKRL